MAVKENLILIFLLISSSVSYGSGRIVKQVEGHDWTLPAHVQPTPGSGLSMVDEEWIERWEKLYPLESSNPDAQQYAMVIGFTWASVNPRPGVYDWSELDRRVKRVEGTPHLSFALWPGIYCRMSRDDFIINDDLVGSPDGEYPMIPKFVNVHYFSNGAPAGWDKNSDYLMYLRNFLIALAERYKDHPRFNYIRAGIMDRSFGEGKFRGLNEKIYRDATERTGLDPGSYEAYLKTITDVFSEAFTDKIGRVAWTNWDNGNSLSKFDPLYRHGKIAGWQYALKKGLGGRDGQVENYQRYLSDGYGNTLDAEGYLVMDYNYAPIREQRIWFTENENMGPKFGPVEFIPYHYFVSTMRLLQMHRNWYWVPFKEHKGHDTEFTHHALTRYSQLTLGKRAIDSADAWCWLRHGWGNSFGRGLLGREEYVVKNMERWLLQRDTGPDGQTQPAAKINIPKGAYGSLGREYEYIARRTDLSSGNNCIYFRVNPDWYQDYARTILLYVTYEDSLASTWRIEYTDKTGIQQASPSITAGTSGAMKTVIFEFPHLKRHGGFAGQMDFCIKRISGGDATIQLVRIVKKEQP